MPLPFNLHTALSDFMRTNGSSNDLYNEISLQLELGIYLRNLCGSSGYKVQFERNINSFVPNSTPSGGFVKKEIDIVIFNGDKDNFNGDKDKPEKSTERYAIELKFPVNGQYPEEMYAFVTDMQFMEEVKVHAGFKETYCITLVEDPKFHTGASCQCDRKGIYQYFRGDKRKHCPVPILGPVYKPTGTGKGVDYRQVASGPTINWQTPSGSTVRRYYILKF